MFKCTTLGTCDLVTKSICLLNEEIAQWLISACRQLLQRINRGLISQLKELKDGLQDFMAERPKKSVSHICILSVLNIYFWHLSSWY